MNRIQNILRMGLYPYKKLKGLEINWRKNSFIVIMPQLPRFQKMYWKL